MAINWSNPLTSGLVFYAEGDFPTDVAGNYGARTSTPSTTTGTFGTAITSSVAFTNSISQTSTSRTVFIWAKQPTVGSCLVKAGSGGTSGWGIYYNGSAQLDWTEFGVAVNPLTVDPWSLSGGAGTWSAFALRRDRSATNDIRWYYSSGLQSTVGGSSYNSGSYTVTVGDGSMTGCARVIIYESLLSESNIISILGDPSQLLDSGVVSKRNLLLRVG